MTCKICGSKSGFYPLCKHCSKNKAEGLISKCDSCKTWFKGKAGLCAACKEPKNVVSPPETTCYQCGKPSLGKPLCYSCWRKKGKEESMEALKATTSEIEQNSSQKKGYLDLYKQVLTKTWDDGIVSTVETYALDSLRKRLNISEKVHKQLEIPIKQEVQSLLKNVKKLENTKNEYENNFRKKFPPKWRTKDGHIVRSKAERSIDNWFYENRIAHCYEMKLRGENVYCDFYLPYKKGIYVEYWGMPEQEKYRKRMNEKIKIYEKWGYQRIDLYDRHLEDPETIFPEIFRELFSS